jgi:DNA-binding HxlR family transcriptional regulator
MTMKKSKANFTTFPAQFRSHCPIACTLDILGDKWTLLVVRDLFLNKHRYGDFLGSPEGIPTNILADRLKRLEAAGILKREMYQDNPPRAQYFLTTQGADLAPVLNAVLKWGADYLPGVKTPKRLYLPEIRD